MILTQQWRRLFYRRRSFTDRQENQMESQDQTNPSAEAGSAGYTDARLGVDALLGGTYDSSFVNERWERRLFFFFFLFFKGKTKHTQAHTHMAVYSVLWVHVAAQTRNGQKPKYIQTMRKEKKKKVSIEQRQKRISQTKEWANTTTYGKNVWCISFE